jgi:glycosyltransferase involved in cell wall biosynthesis
MANLAVVILTFNEALHISRVLENVRPLARQVFVIDSFSSDATVDLARAGGAVVLQNKFVNYARQYQWALAHAPITSEWVMRLDADEMLTPELVAEIERRLPELPAATTGVALRRRHIFLGRWIRHGGRYPLILLRIWRSGAARIEQRWMDEHMVLVRGQAVTFEHDFSDNNLNDITFFTDKHNKYATREAIDVLNQKYRLFGELQELTLGKTSLQACLKRLIKQKLYNRLPLWAGPSGLFLYRYFIRLGVLDGLEGLVYHFLQGMWYRLLVAAKLEEYDRSLRSLSDRGVRLAELARLTGYRLEDLRSALHDSSPASAHEW